jgi:hypothetical protein
MRGIGEQSCNTSDPRLAKKATRQRRSEAKKRLPRLPCSLSEIKFCSVNYIEMRREASFAGEESLQAPA